ncbi:MAG: hypothetical protein Q7S40_25280 [Opitutaceae bacterium]|nr:hypothetical protein [Opitutaceae bacterium]
MFAEITFTEWVFGVGFVVSTLAFVFSLLRYLEERREKRTAEERAAVLESEMREIIRRGRAPFLQAAYLHVPKIGDRPNQIVQCGAEVDPSTPSGAMLQLDVSNDGESVRSVGDDWAPSEGLMLTPWGIKNDPQAAMVCYKYDPALRGQPRRITISFETLDGLKLHQVYETRHGVCDFRRVDPA